MELDLGPKTEGLDVSAKKALVEGFSSFGTHEIWELVLRESGAEMPEHCPVGLPRPHEPAWAHSCRPIELHHSLKLPVRSALLMAGLFELTRRIGDELHGGEPLEPESVFRWARRRLGQLRHEEVWVLGATSQSRLQSVHQVGRGGLTGCSLLARDILSPLLREGAAAFVLVHNHPSGDPEPSELDLEMTRELGAISSRLGVPLLDHLVVTRERFVSMLREGYLSPHQRWSERRAG